MGNAKQRAIEFFKFPDFESYPVSVNTLENLLEFLLEFFFRVQKFKAASFLIDRNNGKSILNVYLNFLAVGMWVQGLMISFTSFNQSNDKNQKGKYARVR